MDVVRFRLKGSLIGVSVIILCCDLCVKSAILWSNIVFVANVVCYVSELLHFIHGGYGLIRA